eukprot:5354059-Prymnesium_polylepis.1
MLRLNGNHHLKYASNERSALIRVWEREPCCARISASAVWLESRSMAVGTWVTSARDPTAPTLSASAAALPLSGTRWAIAR